MLQDLSYLTNGDPENMGLPLRSWELATTNSVRYVGNIYHHNNGNLTAYPTEVPDKILISPDFADSFYN